MYLVTLQKFKIAFYASKVAAYVEKPSKAMAEMNLTNERNLTKIKQRYVSETRTH